MHYALVLLALGALLALHELGHLVAARLLGVRVPRFVFGFGPPMASFRLGGTQFVVGAVPLGATVHIQGMNPHRADAAEAASFQTLGPVRRALIILAGPLTNYLFALGVLFALYTSGTHVVVPLTVGTVRPGSEAARAQLLPGDRIDMVDGQSLRNWTEFVEKVAVGVGRPLELRVERHGEARTVTVRPRPDEQGEGRIGVSQQYVYRTHAPGEALRHSVVHTMNIASEGVAMFLRLAQGDPAHGGPTGPGALVRQESSDAASSGLDSVLRALVAASVALALLTLLPVPGLDGGRVLLLMVEAVSGRRLPPRVETLAQTVGFLAISAIIVAVAAAEIRSALPERFKSKPQTAGVPAESVPQGLGVAGGAVAPATAGGSSTTSPGASATAPGAQQGTPAATPPTGVGAPTATPSTNTSGTTAAPATGTATATPPSAGGVAPAAGTTTATASPAGGVAPAAGTTTATASPAGGVAPATSSPATGTNTATPSPAGGVAPATSSPATGTNTTPPSPAGGVAPATSSPAAGTTTATPANARDAAPTTPSAVAGTPSASAKSQEMTSATPSPVAGATPATGAASSSPATSTRSLPPAPSGAAAAQTPTAPAPTGAAPSGASDSSATSSKVGAASSGAATPTAAPPKPATTGSPPTVSGPPTQ
ncbi:M50 family metallopeptidase [Myxococcus landrumensis]|uniref:Site-2 protease family protein n=1 Tax=Myxococcus landrumensis TaxID=2813577 RepID=A0ABX7NGZ8_9BACT|nr:M50 family metallopeptidase [Myxococcus landrumus]QSQ16651.1 site-2 protease family protein [Myxococcus landrumus]